MPAQISTLVVTLQKHFNKHGDMPVIFRDKENRVYNLLSSGLSYADDVDGNKITVCWLSDLPSEELLEPSELMPK